jgi:hypothetical protein
MTKGVRFISRLAALVSALIMLQTLYFKFSGAEESVYIFTVLGLEPVGRIGVGIAELIASVLLIVPKTRFFGAALGFGLMSGAIFGHLTKLGIVVLDDGGYLFALSLVVASTSLVCMVIERQQLFTFIKTVFSAH